MIALIFKYYFFESFYIFSKSMVPALFPGDFVFVKKNSYFIRNPITKNILFRLKNPYYNDIVVFKHFENRIGDIFFVKRIIGLPGDVLLYNKFKNEFLIISGFSKFFLEDKQIKSNIYKFIVPNNYYFMIGDNIDNSLDSRFFGFVSEKNFIGKVVFIWFSLEDFSFNRSFFKRVRFNRIGFIKNQMINRMSIKKIK